MCSLLHVENLHVCFAAMEPVRGIDLRIDEGEVLGLVGESGSGKSATALAIMGLLGPSAQVSRGIAWRGSDGDVADLLQWPARDTLYKTTAGCGADSEEQSRDAVGPGFW